MIYLIYNNTDCHDGIGSQIQRNLSLYILSKLLNVNYKYNNILIDKNIPYYSIKDIMDENELYMFNNLFNEFNMHINNVHFDIIIYVSEFDINTFNTIKHTYNNNNILVKVSYCHIYIDSHSDILNTYISPKLEWINNTINKHLIIAIHIRRGDVSEYENISRFVNVDFYIDCINILTEILIGFSFEYHIFSDSLDLNEQNKIISYCNTSIIHFFINKSITYTFKQFVNSDILIAGKSSLSYSASFLRQKGIILYIPIRHVYANKHVALDFPEKIRTYKEHIINSIIE
jgi:hypothetical protein